MLNPGQISELTGIPASSLRRYAVQFAKYLSKSAQGRNRKYTERDLSVLIKIRELSEAQTPLEDIPAQLDLVIEQDELPEIPQTSALALLPQLLEDYERINGRIEELHQAVDQALANQERLDQLAQQIEELRAQLEAERNRSWWDRLRGKG